MTREELEIELAKIDWRIEKSGNGLNNFIVNCYGERTAFVVRDSILEIRTNLFGGETSMGRGNSHFELKHLGVRSGSNIEGEKTQWVTIDFGEHNFIQFYNHD